LVMYCISALVTNRLVVIVVFPLNVVMLLMF